MKIIHYATIVVAMLVASAQAEAIFFGKSCVTMPNGEDCVISTSQDEFERLKAEQSARYEAAMRALLENEASGDKLLRQMLDILKDAEQK
jgi:hypothetical protein